MNSKLFVANLAVETTEAGLRAAFEAFGDITEVFLASDRFTGRPRGFGFVTFNRPEEAQLAIEKMNGAELDGRALAVSMSRPKEGSPEAGGGVSSAPNKNFGPDRRAGAFHQRNRNRR